MPGEVAIACRHVADGAPILFAARETSSEGAPFEWRFRCGASGEGDAEGRVLPLEEIVRRDPSAVEIVLRPRGTALRRADAAARWHLEAGPVLFPHRPSRRWPALDPRYPPRPGEPLDGSDLRLMAEVAQWGWHVAQVVANGEAPAYAFTVGLFRSFDHPEVAIFGLAPEVLRAALDRVGGRVRSGHRFEPGDVAGGILDGRAVAFRRIVPRHCTPYLGHAVWYHGGARFPALQGIWSDEAGHFPWERWFPRELRGAQPTLFEPEPA